MNNLKILRGMALPPQPVTVYRSNKWLQISSYELVPGDIVSLGKSSTSEFICPCDMLLLSGTCVVNEAMLTGESTPHLKVVDSMLQFCSLFSIGIYRIPK